MCLRDKRKFTRLFYQPYGYGGGIWYPHVAAYKFGARFYEPRAGRWLTKDPILFGYVMSDPVNFVDPDGLFPKNIDEAGECLLGNTNNLIAAFEKNIQDNNRRITSLKQANTNSCSDSSANAKNINTLKGTNKGLQEQINTMKQKCSSFLTWN